ncbi:serine hydrolase domain-containing protein [Dactylosporangium siamense]|uniref:Serine hydrolase n=1 Tax=Dactylosporangium siamense TaxID=685454 RepID=A0A919PU43_9ACTN|nr:serine hydrolase domain-containing protein [Dactylosporangium siamense]GIG48438.1 serine hydrolase [Dactylosporangium siamense]
MTQRASLTGRPVSRRATLGLLGAAPLAASGALAASPAGAAPAASPAGPPADLRPGGAFDRFVAQLAAEDAFSGTVLLLHRGRRVLARSYGMANQERSIANGPDTAFALGSITKLFTAVAVAQLVQRGTVSFHGTLGTYLDGFPTGIAGTVTVHHLLTHTSGMGDYLQSPGFWAQAATWGSVQQAWDGTMAFVRAGALSFPPGAGHAYSNSAYQVLGAIVAKVSGRSYYDYVREHIFRPAGMTGSDFFTAPQWRDDRRIARPYSSQQSAARVDALDRHIFVGSPAGNSFSTAGDLARFTAALLGDQLLSPVYTRLVLGPKVPISPPPPPPGLPPQVAFETYAPLAVLTGGKWAVGHNGGAPGVSTDLAWYPDSDWVTVLLSNYDLGMRSAVAPVKALAQKLIIRP